jgi:phosphatidylinositol alpha 1,6-mannosyltransferase
MIDIDAEQANAAWRREMPMRILLVTDQYPPMVGGVPTVTHDLAIDLARRQHQVYVIAPSTHLRNTRQLEDDTHVFRFASIGWPWDLEQRIACLPLRSMRRLLKHIDPDVLHIHTPLVLGKIAQYLARDFRKPLIATNHFMPINIKPSLASNLLFNKGVYTYLIHFYNRCSYVTAPTELALQLLLARGLRTPARAISNGVDLSASSPGERDFSVLRRFDLPPACPLVLHVSRLSNEKRIDVLLDAAARLQGDAHIALVGTGSAEASLRGQLKRLRLGHRVSFLGYVGNADLLALRRSAAICAVPSEAELQSLATMEAMACGLPVVAANAGALPELIQHNSNGFLFRPGDSDELASYLDILTHDTDLRTRMGKQSLKLIASHDRSLVLGQWEELYTRLLHASRTTRTTRTTRRGDPALHHRFPAVHK